LEVLKTLSVGMRWVREIHAKLLESVQGGNFISRSFAEPKTVADQQAELCARCHVPVSIQRTVVGGMWGVHFGNREKRVYVTVMMQNPY
jgi:hypothetical protein